MSHYSDLVAFLRDADEGQDPSQSPRTLRTGFYWLTPRDLVAAWLVFGLIFLGLIVL